jgi:hypothetical protein
MQRIATTTKSIDLYGAGKHGFKNGDLATGVLPTDLDAAWFNGAQEELLNAIEENGMAADPNNFSQLAKAISTQATDAATRYRGAATAGCACLIEI